MRELISEYLWMLASCGCEPYDLPKYVQQFPFDARGNPLSVDCLRLRCFIHNRIPKNIQLGTIEVMILNWNIGDIESLKEELDTRAISAFNDKIMREYRDSIEEIDGVSALYSMCTKCNKCDWSDKVGKYNT